MCVILFNNKARDIMRLFIFPFIGLANDAENKGVFGEMIVASVFDPRYFGEEEHYIVNDVNIVDDRGNNHQIDHVVICSNGIFCIETKHMSGSVLADPKRKEWYQLSYGRSYPFYNPLMQNETHARVLAKYLGGKWPIHQITVFTRENKPKLKVEGLLNLSELRAYVHEYKSDYFLSSEEMKEIKQRLIALKES